MFRYIFAFAILIEGLNMASAQDATTLMEKHDKKDLKVVPAIGSNTNRGTIEKTQSKIKPCASKHPPKWCDETKM
jgi:hypothetical protein